jgi:transposase InsO family protein
MSRRGDCYDNAVMESFFSTVKSELADRFDSFGEAKMGLLDCGIADDEGALGSYDSSVVLDEHHTEHPSTFFDN